MGLLDKTLGKSKAGDIKLNKEEVKFILTKLRTADYKGQEFETFYNVYTKLQDQLEKDD